MRSGGTFCPPKEHELARPYFGGRAKQKKAVAGLSISKESAPTLPLLVMSWFPFMLETSSTSNTTTTTSLKIIERLVRMPALEARAISPYHHITIAPYLTPHRISRTQNNTAHVPYLISRAT